MVLNAENFKHYVDRFNAEDVEDVVNLIPNSGAWDWMSSNAPLFQGSARNAKNLAESTGGPNPMVPGGPGTELMDGIESADSDVFSTRIGGLSPVNGTDVPTLLRNLGTKTVVIVGVSSNVAIPNAALDCVN